MYEFRTNNSGAQGKFYEVLDNNNGNNWYITFYEYMSGTIYNQYGYNNHDVTYLSDGTSYRGYLVRNWRKRKYGFKEIFVEYG